MRDFRDYIRFARKCLDLADEKIEKEEDAEWLLIPATIMAWSAMESFVNNRCDDLNSLPKDIFEQHERAFLREQHLRFQDTGNNIGHFELEGKEYQALENKILFLMAKMGSKDVTTIKGQKLWQRFMSFKEIRNGLVHPRRDTDKELTATIVCECIDTAQDIIQVLSEKIWKKKLEF